METQENILSSFIRLFKDKPEYTSALNESVSFRDDEKLTINVAGSPLGKTETVDVAVLSLQSLEEILKNGYGEKSPEMAGRFTADIFAASINKKQPATDVLLHYVFNWPLVVRLFPAKINGVLCAKNAHNEVTERLGDNALFIPWNRPGITSIHQIEKALSDRKSSGKNIPALLMLQNNGILVGGECAEDIEKVLSELFVLFSYPENLPEEEPENLPGNVQEILPALRMLVSQDTLHTLKIRKNSLITHFAQNPALAERLNMPILPADSGLPANSFLALQEDEDVVLLSEAFKKQIDTFRRQNSKVPSFILLPHFGLISIAKNAVLADNLLNLAENLMRTVLLTDSFGGPSPVNDPGLQISDKLSGTWNGRVSGKTIIVTGAAQGFGAGIAEGLFAEGANIVIADLNEEKGLEMADKLNRSNQSNQALFVSVNVADEKSVENLILETVKAFGGIDVYISNAGVLRAGGLDEMSAENFEFMTRVNYTGYFLGAKHASKILKIQSKNNTDRFTDIIQINSKSGLKGSNKNFAYAGSKFGGVGLTQSFALELIGDRIKVNSICPGNFFDGPLWSHPEKGLFVQYLKAGKVPGAKTLEDVKKFYENQVPAKRGCRTEDVMKAIFYVIEQEYETGQAIPVTGGQIMLS